MLDLTIIIPVYNAIYDTIDCIDSIINSDAAECTILIMNDGSVGEISILENRYVANKNVILRSNFFNRGYTRNITYGLREVVSEYVCIINSDTLVPAQWATKLVSALQSYPIFAGVGPLSNAASYQSVPYIYLKQVALDVHQIGSSAEEINDLNLFYEHFVSGMLIDVPLLNGFCTVFRMDALRNIGGFDYHTFKTGYGEEDDLCLRLKQHGYRLAVCPDCFIHHKKSKSFSLEMGRYLSKVGRKLLDSKYGTELIPNLTKQLENTNLLNLMRSITEDLFYSFDECSSGDAIIELQCNDLPRFGRLVKIEGPGSFLISNINITPLEPKVIEEIAFEASSPEGIIVHLPAGRSLPLVTSQQILSALYSLAFQSYTSSVYLLGWHELPQISSNKIEALTFDQLYGYA